MATREEGHDSKPAAEAAPQGRDEIPAALIAAAERLCSSRSPGSVSVRDIAAEARVTSGLVHHYFDSKDELIAATLRAMSEDIGAEADAVLAETDDAGEAVRAIWRFGVVRPAFTMIAAWWLLEGRDVTELMGTHPFLRALAGAPGGPGRDQALTDTAVIGAFVMGGNVLHQGFSRAVGREAGDSRLVEAMEAAVVELARSAQDRARHATD